MLHKPDPTMSRKFGLIPLEDFRYEIFDPLVAENTPPSIKFGFFTSGLWLNPIKRAKIPQAHDIYDAFVQIWCRWFD
jgi:hypothetical protein